MVNPVNSRVGDECTQQITNVCIKQYSKELGLREIGINKLKFSSTWNLLFKEFIVDYSGGITNLKLQ